MRPVKLRNALPNQRPDNTNDVPCTEYVFIQCPHCEFQIETTRKSVKKNKSLLCRTHLVSCPKRPDDAHVDNGAQAADAVNDMDRSLATTSTRVDLPPSKIGRGCAANSVSTAPAKITGGKRTLPIPPASDVIVTIYASLSAYCGYSVYRPVSTGQL